MSVTFQHVKQKSIHSFPEALGIQRYFEFEHQIIRGLSSRSLAKKLHAEGYYLAIKLESLAQKIRSYKREVVLPKIRRLLELESTTNIMNADKAISEQRNIALELSNLIEIQKERVNIGLKKECYDAEIYSFVNRVR